MSVTIDLSNVKNFKEFLGKIKMSHEIDSSIHTLKIYCLNSELSKNELFNQIKEIYEEETKIINDFSETKISKNSSEEDITFYSYKDQRNPIVFVFSITGKSKIDTEVDKLIKNLSKTYYFWMPLSSFEKLKEEIIDKYIKEGVSIDSFSGQRESYYKKNCVFRPENSRKVSYEGEDGIQSLRELEDIYGILPKKIGFSISSKIQFSLNHRNTFIIKRGFPYLGYIWDIINLSLEKYAGIQNVLRDIRFKEIKTRGLIDFDIKPLNIKFGNKKTIEDIKIFFSALEKDKDQEGRYCILNPLLVEGSLFFSAMVLDSNKGSIFSISGDENQMTILPQQNCEKATISRFYEKIDLNLDASTEVLYNEGEI